jgi:hypothetical protein
MVEALLKLFGIPFKIVDRIFGRSAPAAAQEEAQRDNGKQNANEDARQMKPAPKLELDDPQEIKKCVRQLLRGGDIGSPAISAPVLMAIMQMPKDQLRDVASSSHQQIMEFVATIQALTPPAMRATQLSAPTMQAKIAARRQGFQVNQLPTDPEP